MRVLFSLADSYRLQEKTEVLVLRWKFNIREGCAKWLTPARLVPCFTAGGTIYDTSEMNCSSKSARIEVLEASTLANKEA